MGKIFLNFYKLLIALSGLAMLSTLGIVLLGIAARQMKWDIPGLDAYAGYAIVAALFLALPATLRQGDHIRVTLVLDRLSAKARAVLEWGCLIAAVSLSIYIAWYAIRLVWVSYVTHDVSPGADVTPLWIPQLSLALGCIGFALAFAHAVVERLQGKNFIGVTGEASHAE